MLFPMRMESNLTMYLIRLCFVSARYACLSAMHTIQRRVCGFHVHNLPLYIPWYTHIFARWLDSRLARFIHSAKNLHRNCIQHEHTDPSVPNFTLSNVNSVLVFISYYLKQLRLTQQIFTLNFCCLQTFRMHKK